MDYTSARYAGGFACAFVCIHAYIHIIHTYIHTYAYTNLCKSTCMWLNNMYHICMFVVRRAGLYTYTRKFMHVCVCVCVCMYVCICICAYFSTFSPCAAHVVYALYAVRHEGLAHACTMDGICIEHSSIRSIEHSSIPHQRDKTHQWYISLRYTHVLSWYMLHIRDVIHEHVISETCTRCAQRSLQSCPPCGLAGAVGDVDLPGKGDVVWSPAQAKQLTDMVLTHMSVAFMFAFIGDVCHICARTGMAHNIYMYLYAYGCCVPTCTHTV
jgi:hypothetical protein